MGDDDEYKNGSENDEYGSGETDEEVEPKKLAAMTALMKTDYLEMKQ